MPDGCPVDEQLVAAARPDLRIASGPAFARSGTERQTAPDVHARTFGFLRAGAPGDGGQLRATAGTYTAATGYSQQRPQAASALAIARTSDVYIDRSSLRVAYALTDANGEPRVSRSGLSLRVVVTFSDGGATQTQSCALPDEQSGLGECAYSLPASLFGGAARTAQARVSVQYGSSEVASASVGGVTLRPAVSHGGLSAAGMLAVLPQSPRFVDDEFDVPIRAHTGPAAFALKGWSFFVRYDTTVLSLRSSSFTGVYQTPTVAQVRSAPCRARRRSAPPVALPVVTCVCARVRSRARRTTRPAPSTR